MKQDAGPQSINHTGQLPSVTVSFNLKPGVALGDAVDAVQDLADKTLPARIHTNFSGTAKAFQDSLRNMGLLLLIAIAVVYIVLGVLYESFIHPLTILSGLPSAGFGALLTLLIFKVDLSIYAFVGLIMLIGIVKKNAIMQIDFALEAERKHGKTPEDAIVEGCLIRFRPIMMTTTAALFGIAADRTGLGRRRRSTAPSRPGGCRRTGLLATADSLPHAHRYIYYGPAHPPLLAPRQPPGSRVPASRRRPKRESFRNLHTPAGRHHPADGRDRASSAPSHTSRLPVSDLPNVDLPTLLVTASLPGASPETMASSVATPLENQFSTIAGLQSMTSTNTLGTTQVVLEFDLERNLDGAAVDVQSAITQASRLLPQGMPTPPTFAKVNPADQPILYLALASKQLPLYTLDEYAETRIAQRISMVSGVAQVAVLGAQKFAVRVQMDPFKLAARQIGLNEVENALKNWNVNLPTGTINGPRRAFTLAGIRAVDDRRRVQTDYRRLPQQLAGPPAKISGSCVDSVEDDKTASWYYNKQGNERAIILSVQRQPGTNTVRWPRR